MELNWEEFAAALESLCIDTSALMDLAAKLAESWQRAQDMLKQVERLKAMLSDQIFCTSDVETEIPKRRKFKLEKGSRMNRLRFKVLLPWYTSGFE